MKFRTLSGVVVGLANHTLLIAADGSERPIDDSGAPIRNRDGRIVGVVLVFRDVGERPAITYRSTSRAVVSDLQHLLLRFGVVARVRRRPGDRHAAWRLTTGIDRTRKPAYEGARGDIRLRKSPACSRALTLSATR